jgi:hypothetical protein
VEAQAKKSEKFHVQKKHFQEANGKQNDNTVVTQEEVNFSFILISIRLKKGVMSVTFGSK